MKTLAELKRIAKTGTLEARLIKRYNEPIETWPERLKGWRKLVDSNSTSISFLNKDGRKSPLMINRATQVEYDGEHITVYGTGLRDMTPEEERVMKEWEAITQTQKYKDDSWYDMMTDCSTTYYQKKHFFQDRDMLYLAGWEYVRGMQYDHKTGKVFDERVHGDVILQYELRPVEA